MPANPGPPTELQVRFSSITTRTCLYVVGAGRCWQGCCAKATAGTVVVVTGAADGDTWWREPSRGELADGERVESHPVARNPRISATTTPCTSSSGPAARRRDATPCAGSVNR